MVITAEHLTQLQSESVTTCSCCSGYVTTTHISSAVKRFMIDFVTFNEWRDFISFLEDKRTRLIINPTKNIVLKSRLLFRRMMFFNKALYIKRKRNRRR